MTQHDLVHELEQLCAHFASLGLHVDLQVRHGVSTPAQEDGQLIYETARELLLNTLRHARTERAELVVYRTADHELVVTVRDQGVGFDPGILSESHPEIQSGLFILRERLEVRGGGLSIVSLLGKGTVATALFPVEARPADQPDAPPVPSIAAEPSRAAAGGVTVLVVDDHLWVREGILCLLAEHGDLRIVGEAASGEEAIEAARRLKPDLVILDLHLPGIGGIDVTKQIVADNPGTKVLGLSAFADASTLHNLKTAGAAGFLPKDHLVEDLYRTLKSYVSPRSSVTSGN